MKFEDLISELSYYRPTLLTYSSEQCEFSNVKKLHGLAELLERDTVYIGTVTEASRYGKQLSYLTLILVEDSSCTKDLFGKDNSICLVRGDSDLTQLIHDCQRWLSEYQNYLTLSNNLMARMLEDEPLEELTRIASTMLESPIIVLDSNFRILAHHLKDQIVERIWKQAIDRGYCTLEHISSLQKNISLHTTFDNRPIPTSNSDNNLMRVSKLYSKKHHYGYFFFFERQTPSLIFDLKITRLISDVLAAKVRSMNELGQTIRDYFGEHIVIECLNDELEDRYIFNERIRGTEFERKATYQVMSIDVEQYSGFDPNKEVLKTKFTSCFKRSWTVWIKGIVVCLLDVTDLKEPVSHILQKEEAFFTKKSLRIGISDAFTDLFELRSYQSQSLRALELSKQISPDSWLSEFETLKILDLLTKLGDIDLKRYLSSDYMKIKQYDETNKTSYNETIYEYLMNGSNLADTARTLFLHKNTVAYRLSKAKLLFNVDLDNTYTKVLLLLSNWINTILEFNRSSYKK